MSVKKQVINFYSYHDIHINTYDEILDFEANNVFNLFDLIIEELYDVVFTNGYIQNNMF